VLETGSVKRVGLMVLRAGLWLCYPVLIVIGMRYLSPRYMGLTFLVMACLHRLIQSGQPGWFRHFSTADRLAFGAVVASSSLSALTNNETVLRCHPAVVNLVLLALFALTLRRPPSMIERFARLSQPDLSPAAVDYTRNVTRVWCVFLALNAVLALYTAFCVSREIWAIYNGVVAYVLVALLTVGELIWRHLFVLPRAERVKRC
jgi:uncharacterized membrane protein